MNNDLTVGKESKVLLKFCLPLFLSVIFQQLYNITDSFVAGKFISEEALAAVGNSYEITMVFIAFSTGCNMGCSVITARFFGSKRYADMKTAIYTNLLFCTAVCVSLMAIGLGFGDLILKLMRTPEIVFADSKLYLYIYALGLPFVMFYSIATSIFSALGDSKTPFIFLACSSVANVILDIVFVTRFNMGVAGVAWATFICQGVSCVLSMVVVFGRVARIKSGVKPKAFDFSIFKRSVSIMIPSTLQAGFVSVGNIMVQSFINPFGASVMAGYSAAMKVNGILVSSMHAFSNGMSNFTSQNLGAGQRERVRKGFIDTIKMAYAVCIPFMIVYFFFGRSIIYMFLDNPTVTALDTGEMFLKTVALFYFVIGTKIVADGTMRGAGMMASFTIATFSDLILRVALSAIFAKTIGSGAISWSWPIGWIVGAALSLLFYYYGFVKKREKSTLT